MTFASSASLLFAGAVLSTSPASAFVPPPPASSALRSVRLPFLLAASDDPNALPSMNFNLDDEDDGSLSFDDATEAIASEGVAAEEPQEGIGLSQREKDNFYARQDTFDAMRARVDARASELGIEKSSATETYIKEQIERREQKRVEESSGLDLSKIIAKPEDGKKDPFDDLGGTYGLDEDEMAASDPLYGNALPQQLLEEVGEIEWPSAGQVLSQSVVSAVGCLVFCWVLIQTDKAIETVLTATGLYPE